MKALSWMNWALGVWLIAAAFMLSTKPESLRAADAVAGIGIAVLAYASAVGRPTPGLSWSVAIAGLWTVIVNSGAMTVPKWNGLIVGLVVVVLATLNGLYRKAHASRTSADGLRIRLH